MHNLIYAGQAKKWQECFDPLRVGEGVAEYPVNVGVSISKGMEA